MFVTLSAIAYGKQITQSTSTRHIPTFYPKPIAAVQLPLNMDKNCSQCTDINLYYYSNAMITQCTCMPV